MSNNAQLATALVAAVGAAGGAYCVYRAYQAHQNRLPQKWIRVGTLKELHVYPVKSCRPVPKDQAECTGIGLKSGWLRDRALMVVDHTSNAITARNYPELYSVHPSIKDSVLTLSNHDLGSISIDLAEVIALQKSLTSTVWSIAVPVYDCGDEVSDWLTKLMNRPSGTFRLVYYASQAGRKADGDAIGKLFNITNKDTGAFTDDTSYHLINEASVEDLNSRLQDVKVTAKHFRPNFLLAGAKPFDEDDWKFVKIGENIFEVVMPCPRCLMTTADPETGVRDANSEPLRTLRSYRLVEGEKHRKVLGTAPRMGLQLALRSAPGGRVSLNDDIYVA